MRKAVTEDSSFSFFFLLQTVVDQAIDHLLNCTDKLFGADDFVNSSKLSSETKHKKGKIAQSRGPKLRERQLEASISSDSGK